MVSLPLQEESALSQPPKMEISAVRPGGANIVEEGVILKLGLDHGSVV
jgi:hypothetical protein